MTRISQRILLIDDNEELLSLLKLSLQRLGFHVLAAASGATALEIIAQQPVDVVVVDYKMPNMDGEAVAREIRRISPLTPILMFSGALEELPSRVLELVDEFVSKQEPFSNLLYQISAVTQRPYRRKRDLPRYGLQVPFLVIDDRSPGRPVLYGESSDLSEGGMGGRLQERFETAVHGVVQLRVALSLDVPLTARASLRHRNGSRCGFQFLELTDAQLKVIRRAFPQRPFECPETA